MALTELWLKSRDQIEGKHVQQVIAFAGDGQLRDGSDAASEFRDFLAHVPSALLMEYADQCLRDSFNNSGLALQDIINQVGRRLGFEVVDGRYRGTKGEIGHDGLWRFPDGHTVIVEVKTTDAYRVALDNIAGYRKSLVVESSVDEERSSILVVVGRKDTGDLEAQIRGSRHAWDMRLISVDALLRLMILKEQVEDPQTIQRIYDILVPREFTKLDEIIEIVFSTAEEVRQEEELEEDVEDDKVKRPKFKPVSFNDACVARIEKHVGWSLIKRSRASFSSADGNQALVCVVSKEHKRGDHSGYWFAFHPHQKAFLEKAEDSYVAFGCGTAETLLLIPSDEFVQWLDGMNITQLDHDKVYWHVQIGQDGDKLTLQRKKTAKNINLTDHLVPNA